MRTLIARASLLTGCLIIAGCASRPLPKYEKPVARAAVMNVRTTAYTHTESDHVRYSNRNALGGCLRCGAINSAAADWSRWPAGSVFRIRETGEIYQVDDYGWALAGTNTIDLYKPSRAGMNAWGVRRVTIENLRWGDPRRSLSVLRPRSQYRHIKRMIDQLEERMPDWQKDGYTPQLAVTEPVPGSDAVAMADPAPVAVAAPTRTLVARAQPVATQPVTRPFVAESVPRAMAVPAVSEAPARTAQTTRTGGTTATREAFLNSIR